MEILAFVGFKNAGKDTAANYLIQKNGYHKFSFASKLKDIVSLIFSWDRTLLEGTTDISRVWREQVDLWWAERLQIPNFTPRMALQLIGTDAMRDVFHSDIWVFSLLAELRVRKVEKAVITDCRFPNEIDLVKQMGGTVIRIQRGPDPDWYQVASNANDVNNPMREYALLAMKENKIHESEWSWVGNNKIDKHIMNITDNMVHLYSELDRLIPNKDL